MVSFISTVMREKGGKHISKLNTTLISQCWCLKYFNIADPSALLPGLHENEVLLLAISGSERTSVAFRYCRGDMLYVNVIQMEQPSPKDKQTEKHT